MKKYRIIEVKAPARAIYVDEKSQLPEFIRYGTPYYYVEVKEGFFDKWQRLDPCFDTGLAAYFYAYNLTLEPKERVITTL